MLILLFHHIPPGELRHFPIHKISNSDFLDLLQVVSVFIKYHNMYITTYS